MDLRVVERSDGKLNVFSFHCAAHCHQRHWRERTTVKSINEEHIVIVNQASLILESVQLLTPPTIGHIQC